MLLGNVKLPVVLLKFHTLLEPIVVLLPVISVVSVSIVVVALPTPTPPSVSEPMYALAPYTCNIYAPGLAIKFAPVIATLLPSNVNSSLPANVPPLLNCN